jgi:hypothetical protein
VGEIEITGVWLPTVVTVVVCGGILVRIRRRQRKPLSFPPLFRFLSLAFRSVSETGFVYCFLMTDGVD